ncbi:MAG: hypothetical protein WC612_04160 [Bdellovibrionales bacterium]|jgi:hypothetical protein
MPMTKQMRFDVSKLPEGKYTAFVQARLVSDWQRVAEELEKVGGGIYATNNVSRIVDVRGCNKKDLLAIAASDSAWRILPVREDNKILVMRAHVHHLVQGNNLPSKLNIA